MRKCLRAGSLCLALIMALSVSAVGEGEKEKDPKDGKVTLSMGGYVYEFWTDMDVRPDNRYRASTNLRRAQAGERAGAVLTASVGMFSRTTGELLSSAVTGSPTGQETYLTACAELRTADRVSVGGAYRIFTDAGYAAWAQSGNIIHLASYCEGVYEAPPADVRLSSTPYPVNERGETYGSLVISGSGHLDLILARGIDGTSGFVRSEDLELDSWVETSEDAALFMKLYEGVQLIPLYDLEGKVIGSYMITVGNLQETEDGEEPAELLSDTLLEKQAAAGDTTYFDQIKAAMAENAAKLAEKNS